MAFSQHCVRQNGKTELETLMVCAYFSYACTFVHTFHMHVHTFYRYVHTFHMYVHTFNMNVHIFKHFQWLCSLKVQWQIYNIYPYFIMSIPKCFMIHIISQRPLCWKEKQTNKQQCTRTRHHSSTNHQSQTYIYKFNLLYNGSMVDQSVNFET